MITLAILAPLFVPLFIVMLAAVFFSTQLLLVLTLLQPTLSLDPTRLSPTPMQRPQGAPNQNNGLSLLGKHIMGSNCSTIVNTARQLVGKSKPVLDTFARNDRIPLKFLDIDKAFPSDVKMNVKNQTLFVRGAFSITFVDFSQERDFNAIDSEGIVIIYASDQKKMIARAPFTKIRSHTGVVFCSNEYPMFTRVVVQSPITLTDSKEDLQTKATIRNCEGVQGCKESEAIIELRDALQMTIKAINEYQKPAAPEIRAPRAESRKQKL